MRIGIIGYDFPHRKSQEILLHCFLNNIKIDSYFAAPWKKLSFNASSIRTSIYDGGLVDLKNLCDKLGIEYIKADHNSKEVCSYIMSNKLDVSIISGARILGKEIIEAHTYGIINFHPAKLPEYRGLDCHFWSILENEPLGVTAHLIDERMDCGWLLKFRKLPLNGNETIFDINTGLINQGVKMIGESLQIIDVTKKSNLPELKLLEGSNRKIMTDEMLKKTIKILPHYFNLHKNG